MEELNDRERLFAAEYIKNKGNATAAARAAGYKPGTAKNAYEWLLETLPNPTKKRHLPYKPRLKACIEAMMEQIHSERTADAQEVVEYLTSVMRGESESQVVAVEGVGNGVSQAVVINKPPDEKERLTAAKMLGKVHGIFTDKAKVEGVVPVVICGGDDLEG